MEILIDGKKVKSEEGKTIWKPLLRTALTFRTSAGIPLLNRTAPAGSVW